MFETTIPRSPDRHPEREARRSREGHHVVSSGRERAGGSAGRPLTEDDRRTIAELRGGIVKLPDGSFRIEHRVVEAVFQHPDLAFKAVKIVPEQVDARVVGVRVFGVRDGTLLATVGIVNGDRLERINGLDLTSPDAVEQARATLRASRASRPAVAAGDVSRSLP